MPFSSTIRTDGMPSGEAVASAMASGSNSPSASASSEQARVLGHPAEYRRRVEVAGALAGAAAGHDVRALARRVLDELGDLLALRRVDQRADLDALLGAAPDLHRAHLL